VVFVLSGIWHGAGWNFAIWGTVHGTCLIINRLFSKEYTLPTFAAWLLAFLAAMWAWLGFYEVRSDSLGLQIKEWSTWRQNELRALAAR
jgi:D-alanyl-lipoteichoic acid acyltransferase DltB (MBOAT superfamily)